MVALVYIINFILSLIFWPGLFGLAGLMTGFFSSSLWGICAICAIIGIFYGIFSWSYGVPPRWLFVKSQLGLFENLVGNAIGCSIQFFLAPLGITFIQSVVDML